MAMNPMQRKIRNSFLLGFLVAIIVGAIIIVVLFMHIKGLKEEIQAARTEKEIVTTKVYTVQEAMSEGETLTNNENLVAISVPTELVPEGAITDANLDEYFAERDENDEIILDSNGNVKYQMVAKVGISANTILTTDMVERTGNAGTFRNVEYTMISLPSQLEEGDYIDIRLKYPTGEDFIILSKMLVNSTNTNSVWLTVSEGQLLLLNNAIVESYIIDGTMLYATQYTNAAQPELNQTYTPNENVKALIEKNGLAELDKEILSSEDISREYIESLLSVYEQEDKTEKVGEGFTTEKTTIQAAREALLGDMGY